MSLFKKLYFAHDYDASSDDKLSELLFEGGAEAYGVYWLLLENLYSNDNSLKVNNRKLAHNFHTTIDIVNMVINDFDLFTVEDGFISNNGVQKRINELNKKSEEGKKAAAKRWGKKETTNKEVSNTNAFIGNPLSTHKVTQTVPNASKVKKSREEKSKEENIKVENTNLISYPNSHLNISNSDYDNLINEYGKTVIDDYINRVLNYAGSKKYKSLNMTLKNWLNKDNVKPKQKEVSLNDSMIKYRLEGKILVKTISEFENDYQLAGAGIKFISIPYSYNISKLKYYTPSQADVKLH